MKKAKLFTNGRSQAVRLPKEFRFKGDSVNIKKVGNTVVLSPDEEEEMGLGDRLFAAAKKFSPDFMAEGRNQPEQQTRQSLEEMFP